MTDDVAGEAGRIEKIETVRWAAQPNAIWVRIHTSSGHVGLGETYYMPGAVEAIVHDFAADLLLGEPAVDIVRHRETLFACVNFSGHAGAEMRAISAIDLALWDVQGRALGVPVYELLGGRTNADIPVYATCVNAGDFDDCDAFLERPGELAVELADEGYVGAKVWPWDRLAPQIRTEASTGPAGWSAMGPVGHLLTRATLAEGLSVIEAMRDAVGDRLELIVEGHGRWDLNSALRICHALEPFDPLWAEDLMQPLGVEALARLVAESRVPQAVSERLLTRYPFRDVLAAGAAHVAMLDVAWTGGLTEARRIADLAAAHQVPVAPHDCTGPVTAFANLHLCTAVPNAMITEVVRGFVDGWYREVVDERLPVTGGRATAPDSPGLGVSLRDDLLERSDVDVRSSTVN